MQWLIGGVVVWAVVHLVPAAAPGLKAGLKGALGAGPYRGLFSLAVLAGLVAIVVGWRATLPEPVYTPPAWGGMATVVLMFAAVVLFGASHAPTNVRRFIRHPQLTGLVVWSVGHLLANGDIRSVVLFGGLGLWALIEMPLLNRRDGAWTRPGPFPVRSDVITVVVSVVVFAVLVLLHPYFAGRPVPGLWSWQ